MDVKALEGESRANTEMPLFPDSGLTSNELVPTAPLVYRPIWLFNRLFRGM